MQSCRYRLAVISHAGKLWAIGGTDYLDDSNSEVYDPIVNKWSYTDTAFKGSVLGCSFSFKDLKKN